MRNFRIVLLSLLLFCTGHAFAQDFQEAERLNSPNRQSGSAFGMSVAISGNVAIVGAPFENVEGAVFIYEKMGSSWVEKQKIVDTDDAITFDNFGACVSVSGDYAVVGAPNDDGEIYGAVYVLEKNGSGTWSIVQKISNPSPLDSGPIDFGRSVAIDGNYLIVGSLFSAYLYERNANGEWILVNSYQPPRDDLLNLGYGWSVDLSGNQAMVAAYSEEPGGAIYILKRTSAGIWSFHQKLLNTASNSSGMGWTLAMGAQYAVATTSTEGPDTCKAAIFMEKGEDGFWEITQRINGCEVEQDMGSSFGNAGLAVDGNTVLIGSDANRANELFGIVYVFRKDESGKWEIEQEITESSLGAADAIGTSIDLDGDCAVVGAPSASEVINGVLLDGVAYVFCTDVRTGGDNINPRFVKLSVSPNPASDQVIISLPGSKKEFVQVSLFDAQGRLVRRTAEVFSSNVHFCRIKVADLPPGIYFIRVQGEKGSGVGRVVVE